MSHAEPAGEQPPQKYVTEISVTPEPRELQVMHKHAMTGPGMKAGAAQLAGDDPRPDQHPREEPTMSTATTWAPTRAELDQATARTATAIADPSASRAAVYRAAELEEAAQNAYLQRPGADAELQREAELEAGG